MPALLNLGKTAIRDQIKSLVTHVGLASDNTPFDPEQTRINPTSTGTVLIKPSTEVNVDGSTFDASLSVNGDSEFTNATAFTISLMRGPAATDVLSRSVRTQGIGVQAGDNFDVGIRGIIEDNTP